MHRVCVCGVCWASVVRLHENYIIDFKEVGIQTYNVLTFYNKLCETKNLNNRFVFAQLFTNTYLLNAQQRQTSAGTTILRAVDFSDI